LSILGGKTSGYFLISECNNYFRFISLSAVMYRLQVSMVVGLAAPNLPHKFMPHLPGKCKKN